MIHAIVITLIPFKHSIPLGVDVIFNILSVFDMREKL